MIFLSIIVFCISLDSCESRKKDKTHAQVKLTTSTGFSVNWLSYNGVGKNKSGKEIAYENTQYIVLEEGNSATLTFNCSSCGKKCKYKINSAWADIICCDCPETTKKKGPSREYFSIAIDFSPSVDFIEFRKYDSSINAFGESKTP